ncbi:amidohydrolase [Brachyspira hampsonii]|uniref:Amidohydrolase n=1 Tax=Brachyspira hampsonii TaxID=1287055 RepID=A0AAC9TT98_9SPIR|nr:amidohydrolase [Brachyspira hampsonii]ASJ20854.1 amidohydrolase [Brachyspira hampsonii]ELV04954.1 amidohydrolase [Brachyspira hampsonii 30599]MBW5380129.1 amidohydrolase [Brachyspira hampsonii]MBW5409850.1 amidohydrolase [Brachyspira hampsonii]OEJ18947.1 amidohydrolase [Brachyspira hampsonii]
MKKLYFVLLMILSVLSISCYDKITHKIKVYHNGNILTMIGEEPSYARAIEVRDNTIMKIAYTEEDEKSILNNVYTEAVDLKGKTLMPGFIDSHSHLVRFAQALTTVDLTGSTNMLEIAQKITNYIEVNKLKPDAWVVGFGYDNNLLPGKKNPNRDDLDKISTTHPIFITHASGHVGAMNSKALEEFGVNENTPDIPGGVIERYPDSRKPTGYMEEAAFMHYAQSIKFSFTDEDLMNFINQAEDVYLGYGITTAQDALISTAEFPLINNMITNNRFKIDIIGFIDLKNSYSLAKTNSEMLGNYKNRFKIGGYKIFLDGSPQAKTAWLEQPYVSGPARYRGYGIYSNSDVEKFVETALDDKMQLQAHCNGDAAADQYINAFSNVMIKRNTTNNYRAVLVHSQIIREEQYTSMSNFNIIPSIFVAHVYYWGDVHLANLGMERASQISASKTALNNNLAFTYHQDTPVIKPNMLETIWCAVNRITKDGVLLGENQKVTPYEALKAITINAAYQNKEEHLKGTIEEGKLADLVILSDNPLTCDPMKIKDIEVLETIKEGKTLYTKKSEL